MSDGFDFSELADMVDALELTSAESIKESLPIAYVLDHAGIAVQNTGSRLTFFCPFHEDKNTPAGSVFGESLGKWSCWACTGRGGDVFDLIQQLAELDGGSLTFVEACDRARELVSQLEDSNWSGPRTAKPKPTINPDTLAYVVRKAQENEDYLLIDELIANKRQRDGDDTNRYSVEFLVEQFGVGVTDVLNAEGKWSKEIIVPFYDGQKKLVSYKHRLPDSPLRTVGGKFPSDVFYNMWRTDMLDAPILFCEGESDVWNAQFEVGTLYRVLGLPLGAGGSKPANFVLDEFANKDILLAFDGDKAGIDAGKEWAEAFRKAKANVLVAPMPSGKDASSSASSLRALCAAARPIVAAPSGLRTTDKGYVRDSAENATQISNFTLQPIRELISPEASAYEVKLMPGGQITIIADHDMKNKAAIVNWSLQHKRAWYGTDRECAVLLGMMQAASVYLPIGRMTHIAGLHDNHFVWPEGQIGPNPWRYVPPPNSTQLEDSMFIRPGSWSPEYIHILRSIHNRAIIDPILAWLFAAPLRSEFKEFPILAISGHHGSGKTRTVETILRAVTGTYIANTLTGTTPHAVISNFSATNAFPVLFEEYRTGARDDAKQIFEQLARDAYTMQKSQKGGMKGDWAALTNIIPSAPIIVSGEDMFSEGSHVERMILLQMLREGQNPEAFATANSWRNNGLPFAILTWFHRSLMDGALQKMYMRPYTGAGDLGPRQKTNIGILQLGWKFLQMFMEDSDNSIDECDLSMVVSELREANEHTPIEDAIAWCLEESEAQAFVKLKDGNIMIRVENFVSFINERKRRGDLSFTLPGRAPSIKKYIHAKFEATEITEQSGSLHQRWLVFPYKNLIIS